MKQDKLKWPRKALRECEPPSTQLTGAVSSGQSRESHFLFLIPQSKMIVVLRNVDIENLKVDL